MAKRLVVFKNGNILSLFPAPSDKDGDGGNKADKKQYESANDDSDGNVCRRRRPVACAITLYR